MFEIYSGPPVVIPVGITTPIDNGFEKVFRERNINWGRDVPYTPESIAVLAGSSCYDSYHNPAHREDEEYLAQQIVENKHESVIEHVVINFMVMHLPRSTQLELVRHRVGVAYSFRSTRFTDSWLEFVRPPLVREQSAEIITSFDTSCKMVYNMYTGLAEALSTDPLGDEVARTLKRKRVKEAARSILTNNVGSDGMVSLNARAIRHIVKMRSDEHADASIREFAVALYDAAQPLIPSILKDAQEVPVAFGPPAITFGG